MLDANPRHLLVVDDDAVTLGLYRAILTRAGYRLTLRSDPDLSPAEVADLATDALLLDLLFEGENRGLALVDRLREDPVAPAPPILVCTAALLDLRLARERLAAADCTVLTKPFAVRDLLDALAGLVGRERLTTAA